MSGPMTAADRIANPTDEELLGRFAPLFAQIAEGAAQRELEQELPFAEVVALREEGFGALRLPVERGGHGASIRQLLVLLRELGAADSNLPQALRQHWYQVDPSSARWLERVAAGDLFGSATTEPRGSAVGELSTVLRQSEDGGYRLTGRKIYGTGNAYAQWIPVAAIDERGARVFPVVPADRDGVTLLEDWNGFGQRLTATSTTVFEDVEVHGEEVRRPPGGGVQTGGVGLHQSVLLAAQAGVIEAAARDLTRIVRGKQRVYFLTGTGEVPRNDPIVQEHVGRVRAAANAGALLIDGIGRSLQSAWDLWHDDAADPEKLDDAFLNVELTVGSTQVVLSELALSSTAHLMDVLGASSLDRGLALDRHWRNVRALASHNPYPFRARMLGDHALNGTLPRRFVAGEDVGDKR